MWYICKCRQDEEAAPARSHRVVYFMRYLIAKFLTVSVAVMKDPFVYFYLHVALALGSHCSQREKLLSLISHTSEDDIFCVGCPGYRPRRVCSRALMSRSSVRRVRVLGPMGCVCVLCMRRLGGELDVPMVTQKKIQIDFICFFRPGETQHPHCLIFY